MAGVQMGQVDQGLNFILSTSIHLTMLFNSMLGDTLVSAGSDSINVPVQRYLGFAAVDTGSQGPRLRASSCTALAHRYPPPLHAPD